MRDMQHAHKRMVSLLVAVLLMIGTIPFGGFSMKVNAASIGTSSVYSYEQLKEALGDPDIDEVVIPLGASFTISGTFYGNGDVIVPEGKTLLIQGSLTTTAIHNGSYFTWSILNQGNIVVQNGGILTLSSGGHGGVASISNSGFIDIQSGSELNITAPDYENYGILVYHTGGNVRLAGNVNITNTGTNSRGIWMWDDYSLLEIAGGSIYIQTGSEAWQGILANCDIEMTGGNVTIDNGYFYSEKTFFMSGGTITSNKTYGIYNSGRIIMAGGRIIANPNVTNAFYNDRYSSITFLDTKDSVSGTIGYDPAGGGAMQLFYGTVVNLFDSETLSPIDFSFNDRYGLYDYNGLELVPIDAKTNEMTFYIDGYEYGPYELEPVTDAQQVRNIYINPYRPPTVSERYLTIPKGQEKTVDIDLGKYSNAHDYAIIEGFDENVVAVSQQRLEQNGQITVIGVNSGYTGVTVTFKGGSYDWTEYIYVDVPFECNIEAVNKPSGAVMDGTNISASVPYSVATQEIDVDVSEGAIWKLYSDPACRREIENNTMDLSVGENTAYIWVRSLEYDVMVYTLTITRAANEDNGSGFVAIGGGGGGRSGSGSGGGSDAGSGGSAVSPTAPAPVTGPVSVRDAGNAARAAVEAAKQAGGASAVVRFKNVGELSLEAAQAMITAAGDTPIKVHGDSTLNNGAVDVRITFNPAQMTKAVNLSASTVSSRAVSTKNLFARGFTNRTQVVSFAQQGDFGLSVEAAVKLDKDFNAQALVFYSYDKAANAYKPLANTGYWLDQNGYVHFHTSVAGDIIITDQPLAKKISVTRHG